MAVLQRVFLMLLLLGFYHVILQQFSAEVTASVPASRPCRNGKVAGAVAGVPADEDTRSSALAHGFMPRPRAWVPPAWSNLEANVPAALVLGEADPATTTLHFTFGSASMMQFFRNWLHFVRRAGIAPVVIGAADKQMFVECTREGIAAIAIAAGLDGLQSARIAHK